MFLHIHVLSSLLLLCGVKDTFGVCCPQLNCNMKRCCYNGDTSGDWCCGRGPCNIFCCNCDGGCKRGYYDTSTTPVWETMGRLSEAMAGRKKRSIQDTGMDYFKSIDLDMDGFVNFSEANNHFGKVFVKFYLLISVAIFQGGTLNGTHFSNLDKDMDGLLDMDEFGIF